MFTRHFIDSVDFARRGGELSGEVPLTELGRMADVLAAPEGAIKFVLRGFVGKDGKPQLELILNGRCLLRCQRCLSALEYPVKLAAKLRLVSEGQQDNTDFEDDETDSIPAEKRLDVLALLEEELLLSLPIAPKHVMGECQLAVKSLKRSNNPFEVLTELKK